MAPRTVRQPQSTAIPMAMVLVRAALAAASTPAVDGPTAAAGTRTDPAPADRVATGPVTAR